MPILTLEPQGAHVNVSPFWLLSITPFALRSHSGMGNVAPALSMSRERRALFEDPDPETTVARRLVQFNRQRRVSGIRDLAYV